MKNLHWRGLLGTLGLHAIVLGIMWAITTRASIPFQEKGVLEIQVYSANQAREAQEENRTSESLLPSTNLSKSSDNQAPEETESAIVSIPDTKLLLPPKEVPYLPAGEADVRPQPESPIVVPYPDSALGRSKGEIILILYINEVGEVDYIQIDKSDLPTVFEEEAINAFSKARMHPAVKEGKKIKSRMKVLVEFETK